MREVVERALQRELAARYNLRPHAQLGIAPDATSRDVDRAYASLRSLYETVSLAEYGAIAVETANAIAELLRIAHETMQRAHTARAEAIGPLRPLDPKLRADETCRALETLRAAIARRLALACEHQRNGRLDEAIRGFESVLLLDRHHQTARDALTGLRAAKRSNAFTRLISRLFKRPAFNDVDSTVSESRDAAAH